MENLSQLPVPPSDDDDDRLPDEEESDGDSEGAEDPPDADEIEEAKPLDADVPDDGGPRASEAERHQMLKDLNLRARLVAFVRRKPLPSDKDPEDVAHDILIAAFEAARLPAGNGDDRDRYVFGIGKRLLANLQRRAARKARAHKTVKVRQPVEASAGDIVAQRNALEALRKEGATHDDLYWLARWKFGRTPLTKLLIEAGETEYMPFYRRINGLFQRAVAIGGAVAAVLVLIGVLRRQPVPQMAFDEPGPVVTQEQAVSTHVGEIDVKDTATLLRARAFRACLNQEWRACLDGLAHARDLDPDGASDPVVQAAVLDAADGVSSKTNRHPPGYVPPYASRAAR